MRASRLRLFLLQWSPRHRVQQVHSAAVPDLVQGCVPVTSGRPAIGGRVQTRWWIPLMCIWVGHSVCCRLAPPCRASLRFGRSFSLCRWAPGWRQLRLALSRFGTSAARAIRAARRPPVPLPASSSLLSLLLLLACIGHCCSLVSYHLASALHSSALCPLADAVFSAFFVAAASPCQHAPLLLLLLCDRVIFWHSPVFMLCLQSSLPFPPAVAHPIFLFAFRFHFPLAD